MNLDCGGRVEVVVAKGGSRRDKIVLKIRIAFVVGSYPSAWIKIRAIVVGVAVH